MLMYIILGSLLIFIICKIGNLLCKKYEKNKFTIGYICGVLVMLMLQFLQLSLDIK